MISKVEGFKFKQKMRNMTKELLTDVLADHNPKNHNQRFTTKITITEIANTEILGSLCDAVGDKKIWSINLRNT